MRLPPLLLFRHDVSVEQERAALRALTVIRRDESHTQADRRLCVRECGGYRSVIEWKLLKGVVAECVRCDGRRKMERAVAG